MEEGFWRRAELVGQGWGGQSWGGQGEMGRAGWTGQGGQGWMGRVGSAGLGELEMERSIPREGAIFEKAWHPPL